MQKSNCHIYQKLQSGQNPTKEEIKTIMNIVRNQLNFMIRNNILMTPLNYERWFMIFCTLEEEKKELTDLEIVGLFKETFDAPYNEIKEEQENIKKPENFTKKLNSIASIIDKKLLEIIESLDSHTVSLDNRSDIIRASHDEMDIDRLSQTVLDILSELQELKNQNRLLKEDLSSYHAEILVLQDELKIARIEADFDFLTGLANRRRFERATADLLRDYKEKNYPFSLVFIDLDNFKQINDTYGHPLGDIILKEVAKILKTYLRTNSISARLGGEEFAILLPGSEINETLNISERLRSIIENRDISLNDSKKINFTASFGVTSATKEDTVSSLLKRVDDALYEAKRGGKNRIVIKK